MPPDFALAVKIIAGSILGCIVLGLIILGAAAAAEDDRNDFNQVCKELGARTVITDEAWLCVRDGEVVYTD